MTYTPTMVDIDALIVEPSAVQAKIMQKSLESLGVIGIRAVANAAEALEAMASRPPSVVISAMYLPDLSGSELVQRMRADSALEAIAFILISSETRPQQLDDVRQSGVCGILPKPFALSQLETALKATLQLQGSELGEKEFDGEDLRVLLVDDMPSARKFMRRVLEHLGFTDIVEAENGRQAIQRLDDVMVDLIVTDYNMPEMDGQAFTAYVREQSWQSSVPILMVTSEHNSAKLAAVEESGVSGICDKPFEPTALSHLLHTMLEDRLAQ